MREPVARAAIGDVQCGEDPSANELPAKIAGLLGKKAALVVPHETLAEQITLCVGARPRDDDVIVGTQTPAVFRGTGPSGANNSIQFTEVGSDVAFTADELLEAIRPRRHPIDPPAIPVEVEKALNRSCDRVSEQKEYHRIGEVAAGAGSRSSLHGVRLFRAVAANGCGIAHLAASSDLASISFWRGLGAPAGSLIAGSRGDISILPDGAAPRHLSQCRSPGLPPGCRCHRPSVGGPCRWALYQGMRTIVLGAGTSGATIAYCLARLEHEVEVIEQRPNAAEETSFGNGGVTGFTQIRPWASPEVPWKILGWIGRSGAPIGIGLGEMTRHWRRGFWFLRNCSAGALRRRLAANGWLALSGREAAAACCGDMALPYDHWQAGALKVFAAEAALDQGR